MGLLGRYFRNSEAQSGAVTSNVTTAESQSETYTKYSGVDGVKKKKRSEAYLRLVF